VIPYSDKVSQNRRFLADVHTLEVVVLQQVIATVFKLVDSVEFKIAEWAHRDSFERADADQLSEGEGSDTAGF
jgi:hypothetical protein